MAAARSGRSRRISHAGFAGHNASSGRGVCPRAIPPDVDPPAGSASLDFFAPEARKNVASLREARAQTDRQDVVAKNLFQEARAANSYRLGGGRSVGRSQTT